MDDHMWMRILTAYMLSHGIKSFVITERDVELMAPKNGLEAAIGFEEHDGGLVVTVYAPGEPRPQGRRIQ